MKISATMDKRILERELHLQGRVLTPQIEKLRQELPDLASRVAADTTDPDTLRDRLKAEAEARAERIRRSLADPAKHAATLAARAELDD